MSSWQKMELDSWPTLLDEVMDQYENNAKKVSGMLLHFCYICIVGLHNGL
jgi:hypothetical protein